MDSTTAQIWFQSNSAMGVEYSIDPSGVIYVMNGPAGSQTRVPYVANDPRYAYAEASQAASWAELSFEGDIVTVTVKYHDGTNENVYHTWGIKKDASNKPALRISSVYPYADFAKAYLEAEDPNIVVASTEYSTHIHASIEQGNVFACQFHPEKSSDTGLAILRNFVEL